MQPTPLRWRSAARLMRTVSRHRMESFPGNFVPGSIEETGGGIEPWEGLPRSRSCRGIGWSWKLTKYAAASSWL